MVIVNEIKKKFKEYFGLNLEKYKDEDYSALIGQIHPDCFKMYDYFSRKYQIKTNMVDCIEEHYGKECREWYETTFLNKKTKN